MPTQLRIYTIKEGKLDDFVSAWLGGVRPLRVQHGFRIDGAWLNPERSEFVWLLSYDGPDVWKAKEAAYYGSAERLALKPDPAQWIVGSNVWFLSPVLPPQRSR